MGEDQKHCYKIIFETCMLWIEKYQKVLSNLRKKDINKTKQNNNYKNQTSRSLINQQKRISHFFSDFFSILLLQKTFFVI